MKTDVEIGTRQADRPRLRQRLWAGIAVALAVTVLLAFWIAQPTGPRYDGQPLRHWLLLAASADHRDQLRADAVLRTVGPEAVPELIRALETRESRLQRAWQWIRERVFRAEPELGLAFRLPLVAVEQLARLGPAASNAVPALLRWGASRPTPLVARCIQAIGVAATPHVLASLKSSDPRLRSSATAAAASVVFRPAADAFVPSITALLQDTDAGPRIGAIRALPVLAPCRPDAAAAVAALLPGADERTALTVLESLRGFGLAATDSAGLLQPLLETPSPGIRLAVARTLRAIRAPAPEVLPVLVELLREPDVQFMAAHTLGEMGLEAVEAIPALLTQLELTPTHRPSRTPSFAAIALRHLGPTAVPGLVKLLGHASSDVRVNAAVALGGQGTAAAPAVPGLIRMLSAADLEEQMAAANALGEIGPVAEPAVPELTRLANLETTQDVIVGHVRSAARDALERIRVPPAGR